jgi:hypothetical protein
MYTCFKPIIECLCNNPAALICRDQEPYLARTSVIWLDIMITVRCDWCHKPAYLKLIVSGLYNPVAGIIRARIQMTVLVKFRLYLLGPPASSITVGLLVCLPRPCCDFVISNMRFHGTNQSALISLCPIKLLTRWRFAGYTRVYRLSHLFS